MALLLEFMGTPMTRYGRGIDALLPSAFLLVDDSEKEGRVVYASGTGRGMYGYDMEDGSDVSYDSQRLCIYPSLHNLSQISSWDILYEGLPVHHEYHRQTSRAWFIWAELLAKEVERRGIPWDDEHLGEIHESLGKEASRLAFEQLDRFTTTPRVMEARQRWPIEALKERVNEEMIKRGYAVRE